MNSVSDVVSSQPKVMRTLIILSYFLTINLPYAQLLYERAVSGL